MTKIAHWTIRVISVISFLLCAISCSGLLIVGVGKALNGQLHISFTVDGVSNMIDLWSQYASLLKVMLLSATLYVANYHLDRFMKQTSVQCLSDIRSKLSSKENLYIHKLLEGKNYVEILDPNQQIKRVDNIKIFQYLGTIELAAMMLKDGLISFDEFDNQFGYRVKNIMRNDDLMRHLQDNREYYSLMFYVMSRY